MAVKAILVLCVQALLIQSAFSQYLGRRGCGCGGLAYEGLGLAGRGYGYDGLGLDYAYDGIGCGGLDYTVTSGGGLPVSSASCIPPVGISVDSENEYGGTLCAAGELPFVGTVGVEGVLPTAGAGAVNYGCGNGVTAMAADVAPGIGLGEYGLGIGEYGLDGYGAGLGYRGFAGRGRGCGCGCGRGWAL